MKCDIFTAAQLIFINGGIKFKGFMLVLPRELNRCSLFGRKTSRQMQTLIILRSDINFVSDNAVVTKLAEEHRNMGREIRMLYADLHDPYCIHVYDYLKHKVNMSGMDSHIWELIDLKEYFEVDHYLIRIMPDGETSISKCTSNVNNVVPFLSQKDIVKHEKVVMQLSQFIRQPELSYFLKRIKEDGLFKPVLTSMLYDLTYECPSNAKSFSSGDNNYSIYKAFYSLQINSVNCVSLEFVFCSYVLENNTQRVNSDAKRVRITKVEQIPDASVVQWYEKLLLPYKVQEIEQSKNSVPNFRP